ncbi:UDP-3-O-(3-hydroxymyristoyl)glucosamine N-acyltransferase [Synechococcus sp. RSCCF101]|uniref:UDP-3-O-(3-hydroxymyristoyl)glucosamine N-acyltransferase n=1 Tax=Synechococcus sp. RSCCF101 TaxID=2511069 RepID=UPI001247F9DB|nr:UDP-3-O-(3-hydroxymyristoyl)glucosamine N-acyltransferase [Synechococcus sp. RSCCF101]QEY31651.1 UDP-3-O-(3-hydroxymyristoyl)glucosamine N-acyltransferase [Synechococcus sp. RSCCF101]
MRFSELLSRLSIPVSEDWVHLGSDPEIERCAALDADAAQALSFLEPGSGLDQALEATGAAAVLLPREASLLELAGRGDRAWAAVDQPRLVFARALALLHPLPRPEPGVHPTAVVDPSAQLGQGVSIGARVVIGPACRLADGCVVHAGAVLYGDVALEADCEIHANAVLEWGCRLGRGCVIQANAVIGGEGFGFVPTAEGWVKMPQTGRVVLGDGVEVGSCSTIDRPSVGETLVGPGTKIDNLVHVGHGVRIGSGCALAAQVGIAGGAELGHGVILAGQVGVANRSRIGDRAIASSKSGIHGEIAAGEVVSGYPAIPNRLWLRCAAAFNRLPEMARTLKRLQR